MNRHIKKSARARNDISVPWNAEKPGRGRRQNLPQDRVRRLADTYTCRLSAGAVLPPADIINGREASDSFAVVR